MAERTGTSPIIINFDRSQAELERLGVDSSVSTIPTSDGWAKLDDAFSDSPSLLETFQSVLCCYVWCVTASLRLLLHTSLTVISSYYYLVASHFNPRALLYGHW